MLLQKNWFLVVNATLGKTHKHMATNIDSNGNYPMSDKAWPSFETMWKEHLAFMPQVILMDWKERDKWKEFASSIYDSLVKADYVQSAVNEAFEDGYDAGVDSAQKGAQNVLEEAKRKYPLSPAIDFFTEKLKTI